MKPVRTGPAGGPGGRRARYGHGVPTTFNAPPGWPVPPAGWTPPAGWRPDPAWPTAPDGWQFWVDAPAAAGPAATPVAAFQPFTTGGTSPLVTNPVSSFASPGGTPSAPAPAPYAAAPSPYAAAPTPYAPAATGPVPVAADADAGAVPYADVLASLRSAARRTMLMGALFLVGGLGISAVTYLTADPGGRYLALWGAVIFGALRLVQGVVAHVGAERTALERVTQGR